MTHSGAWLGLISLADFLPVLFLAPFAGVLADRRDRVWTIRITQWIGCAQASLLAILVVSDAMTIEILFALVLMLGIASGVAQPSRLALCSLFRVPAPALRRDTIIGGGATNCGVETSVRYAFDLDLACVVVRECCWSRDEPSDADSRDKSMKLYVRIRSLDQVTATLQD